MSKFTTATINHVQIDKDNDYDNTEHLINENTTSEQSPVYNTDNPSELDYKDLLCTVADPYDWTDDDIDNVCAIVDTGGAMVTCKGTEHIIHHYKPYTKLKHHLPQSCA